MKMLFRVLLLILVSIIWSGPLIFSQEGDKPDNAGKLDLIIGQMRQEQKLNETDPLDPDKISNRLLEKLGRELASESSSAILKKDLIMPEEQRKEVYKREGYRYILVNSKIPKVYQYPLQPSGYQGTETDVTCPKCGNIWGFGGSSTKEKGK
jgi:hypothetical protein